MNKQGKILSSTNEKDYNEKTIALTNPRNIVEKFNYPTQEEITKKDPNSNSISFQCKERDWDIIKSRDTSTLNSMNINSNMKIKSYFLSEASPSKLNYANNLMISPIVDNRHKKLFQTPNMNDSMQGRIQNLNSDMKIDSPFPDKMPLSSVLRHSEKSSSFKHYQLSKYTDSISGRNIDFEHPPRARPETPIPLGGGRKFQEVEFSPEKSRSDSECEYSNEMDVDEENHDIPNKAPSNECQTSPPATRSTHRSFGCTCVKSQCLKKYCECFANKKFCSECECTNCYNQLRFKDLLKRSLNHPLNENQTKESYEVICNCTKSNCMKKYCECYKAKEKCKEECRCIDCENIILPNKMSSTTQKQQVLINPSENLEKKKLAKNPQNFIIEGTSVFINNENIMITTRKEVPQKCITREFDILPYSAEKPSFALPNQSSYSSLKKLFEINQSTTCDANTSTPMKLSKKRKRVGTERHCSSFIKSSSTHFQTPMFTTSSKISKKRDVNLEVNHVIKKLEI